MNDFITVYQDSQTPFITLQPSILLQTYRSTITCLGDSISLISPTNSSHSDNQHKHPSRLDIRQVVCRFLPLSVTYLILKTYEIPINNQTSNNNPFNEWWPRRIKWMYYYKIHSPFPKRFNFFNYFYHLETFVKLLVVVWQSPNHHQK